MLCGEMCISFTNSRIMKWPAEKDLLSFNAVKNPAFALFTQMSGM
jgi:hypothetical protein